MEKIRDRWRTPKELFLSLNDEFKFTVDACANKNNNLCDKYYSDCLLCSWKGERVFMNPPYSNPRPFLQKAYDESKHCLVVALIKCDPSTRLWSIFYDYDLQKFKNGIKIRFYPKRIKFMPPLDSEIISSSTNFSSCLIIMDRREFI